MLQKALPLLLFTVLAGIAAMAAPKFRYKNGKQLKYCRFKLEEFAATRWQ